MIVGLVLLSSLAVFGQSDADRYGGTFTAAVKSNPVMADPHLSTSTSTRIYAVHVFETLFTYDENYTVQPMLASDWEVSADGLVWTIGLREGVLFHNGKEMTSEDVKASLDRFRTYGARKSEIAYITSIDIVDQYTLEFVLNSPVTTLLANLANPLTVSAIFPKEIIENRSDEILPEEVIGTGPYKLATWLPDVEFRLERFENYVPNTGAPQSGLAGYKKAYFDTVILVPVPEVGSRMAGLETGLYDFAEGIANTSYDRLVSDTSLEPLVLQPLYSVIPELNKTMPPIDNLYFRQALVAAINCENVMKAVTMGNSAFYRIQPSIFFPEQEAFWTDAGSEYYNAGNTELAKELLAKAGYNGEEIIFIANPNYDWGYRSALAITQDLIAAGINIKLEFYDWVAQLDIMRSLEGWHIAQSAWSLRFDPTAIDSSVRPGSMNSYGYENPQIGELIDAFRVAADDAARKDLVEQIMTVFYTDVPHLRIGDYFGLWGSRSNIEGMAAWYVPIAFNVWREK